VDYKVRLVTTKPNYGGRRWWFICPLVRRPHAAAKLDLPSGGKYFGAARPTDSPIRHARRAERIAGSSRRHGNGRGDNPRGCAE
jgi:hypothetical protein